MIDRYSRQINFPHIGEAGQKKIGNSSVVIIGCGGLGSTQATIMARAGIGRLRVIDCDLVEFHNLHRQILYDENDVEGRLPKAIAAERHLKKINSSIEIEGIVAEVNCTNVEKLVAGFDLILDGLDNLKTRFLINDVSLKKNIPWIYGGVVYSLGMVMPVIPHRTPCLRCYSPYPSADNIINRETSGIIGPAPVLVGALQCADAMRILVGVEKTNRGMLSIDVWTGFFQRVEVSFREDCPACHGKYEFLEG